MITTVQARVSAGLLLLLATGCAPAGPAPSVAPTAAAFAGQPERGGGGPAPSVAPTAAADPANATTVNRSRQCFHASSVSGFQTVDERTVDLIVGANRLFRVGLSGTCPEIRDAVAVGVRTRGGSDFICDDNDVELVTPRTTIGPRICSATSLRLRTPAELEAERRAR